MKILDFFSPSILLYFYDVVIIVAKKIYYSFYIYFCGLYYSVFLKDLTCFPQNMGMRGRYYSGEKICTFSPSIFLAYNIVYFFAKITFFSPNIGIRGRYYGDEKNI